jgi:hypothetical protein
MGEWGMRKATAKMIGDVSLTAAEGGVLQDRLNCAEELAQRQAGQFPL